MATKTEFSTYSGSLPIPDDLTVAQFILDEQHVIRPLRPADTPWLIDDASGHKVYFEEVRARVDGLANALSIKYGIKENDCVCIFSTNHIDYPIAIWAVHRLGAIVSGANPAFTAPELATQLAIAKASLILAEGPFLPVAQDAARRAGVHADHIALFNPPASRSAGKGAAKAAGAQGTTIEELVAFGLDAKKNYVERQLAAGEGRTKVAFLSFSSGTTGKPKAVAIPHYAPIANVVQMATHSGTGRGKTGVFAPGDTALQVLPLFHIYGLVVNLHFNIFAGLSVVLISKFNFEPMLKSIVRYHITHLYLVPPQVVLLCKRACVKKYNLRHVKFLMSGAAPLTAELSNQLVSIVPHALIGQGYGMTELSTTVSFPRMDKNLPKPGGAGHLIPAAVCRILKDDGTWGTVGEIGELIVKSPAIALGYTNDEKATRETFRDGWLHTGDVAYIDKDDELYVVDRLKELIKVQGYQVAPAELEGHLLDHPDVADVCVIGVPDEYAGELPFAFVVPAEAAQKRLRADAVEAERLAFLIRKHVSDAKVKYKWLVGVQFVDAIPKNPSGKLLRRVLRERAKALRAGKLEKAKL